MDDLTDLTRIKFPNGVHKKRQKLHLTQRVFKGLKLYFNHAQFQIEEHCKLADGMPQSLLRERMLLYGRSVTRNHYFFNFFMFSVWMRFIKELTFDTETGLFRVTKK